MLSTEDILIDTVKLMIFGIGVPLVLLFFLGFLTAFLQAITQIQDQMLSFLPKIFLLSLLVYLFFNMYFGSLVEMLRMSLTT